VERQPYDHRNCQSLFGYAAAVHERSGGVCQLCGAGAGAGAGRVDFDWWRQLTVEHLIGESQGGYLAQIRLALRSRLPDLPQPDLEGLASAIDVANTITACSFCNSTTSRGRVPVGMTDAIRGAPPDPEALFAAVTADLAAIADQKRADVEWKIRSVRRAFEEQVAPKLNARRAGSQRSS
jgi:hypothetical protein